MTTEQIEVTSTAAVLPAGVVDIFASFAVDPKKEKNGVSVALQDCGATKWLIARTGSPEYNRLANMLFKRHRAVLDVNDDAAKKKSDEIMAEIFAATVLLGWEGQVAYKGQLHSYSRKVAQELLIHPAFRAKVEMVAGDFNAYKVEQDNADLKN